MTITLRVEQLPAACRKQGLLLMWEGGLMSVLDAVDTVGLIDVRAQQFASTGSADFVIRWNAG